MDPEERAVRQAHEAFINAVNAADLDRVLSLMTDDVVFLNPWQEPFGRQAFPVGFLDGHRQFHLVCVSYLESVEVAGDVAYTVCRDTVHLVPRSGGAESELAGYRLTVYRRQPDGRWLMARDAHTAGASGEAGSGDSGSLTTRSPDD